MRKTKAERPTNKRITDHIYNGSFEPYEDPADYIDVKAALRGRVIA